MVPTGFSSTVLCALQVTQKALLSFLDFIISDKRCLHKSQSISLCYIHSSPFSRDRSVRFAEKFVPKHLYE